MVSWQLGHSALSASCSSTWTGHTIHKGLATLTEKVCKPSRVPGLVTSLINFTWLVVLTILKNMSQWEGWHPIYDMENKKSLKPPTSDKQLEITGHHLEWLIVISSYFKKVMICYDSNNLIFNLRFKLLISITCAVLIPSSRARHCYSNWWWVIISHDHPQKLDPVPMKPPQRSYTSRWCIQQKI